MMFTVARRMDGFKLCVTNTSITPPDRDACYEDPGPGLPNITQTISFNQLGKYVIYYDDKGSQESKYRNDSPVIELCYVAINDNLASDSLVSQNPSSISRASLAIDGNKTSCSTTIGNTVAYMVDLKNASIVTGLMLTFGGCPPTHYGLVCTELCPQNCHGPCDLDSGNCIFGCLNGWTGDKCKRECSNGNFGTNCSSFCEGCLHHTCDPVDGLCDNTTICHPGYVHGDYCDTACNNWYFGTNCTTECNCLAGPCNKVDGICPFGGCKEGWHGESCNQKCNEGYFGRNCDRSCDGCISNNCDTTDGLCYITTGCEPGYLNEEYCNNTCEDWYFGNNCTMECNCLTGPCNRFTGTCPPGGCKTGWQGDSCYKGGVMFGVLVTVAVSFLVQRKRQLQKTQGKENKTLNTQSHEQQHYDDVQHVQMENVSTYQDLITPQTSNVYDQINTTYVNQ
ncbi:MEGF10_11 [Mytilus edulis]|uniref:MEGF10_11 n=1 Tax=Mytilus edulis TaxID=6550 RepID=A0A8S3QDL8_MYTED|nr:MEGF10_11 [Mytilus edulis]